MALFLKYEFEGLKTIYMYIYDIYISELRQAMVILKNSGGHELVNTFWCANGGFGVLQDPPLDQIKAELHKYICHSIVSIIWKILFTTAKCNRNIYT